MNPSQTTGAQPQGTASPDPAPLLAKFDELARFGEGAPEYIQWVNSLPKESLHALALALGQRSTGVAL